MTCWLCTYEVNDSPHQPGYGKWKLGHWHWRCHSQVHYSSNIVSHQSDLGMGHFTLDVSHLIGNHGWVIVSQLHSSHMCMKIVRHFNSDSHVSQPVHHLWFRGVSLLYEGCYSQKWLTVASMFTLKQCDDLTCPELVWSAFQLISAFAIWIGSQLNLRKGSYVT